MIPNFFFGGSHCQSVIRFLDEIGGWREEGVLFNSARGPNTTNHSALGPAIMACLRGLMENIINVVQHTFLLTVKKTYIYIYKSFLLFESKCTGEMPARIQKVALQGIRFRCAA